MTRPNCRSALARMTPSDTVRCVTEPRCTGSLRETPTGFSCSLGAQCAAAPGSGTCHKESDPTPFVAFLRAHPDGFPNERTFTGYVEGRVTIRRPREN
jgi:hypothetical protein